MNVHNKSHMVMLGKQPSLSLNKSEVSVPSQLCLFYNVNQCHTFYLQPDLTLYDVNFVSIQQVKKKESIQKIPSVLLCFSEFILA